MNESGIQEILSSIAFFRLEMICNTGNDSRNMEWMNCFLNLGQIWNLPSPWTNDFLRKENYLQAC